MALNVTFNTPATSNTGASLDSVHIRLDMSVLYVENQIELRHKIYVDEAAFLAERDSIILDEIPSYLQFILSIITPVQYADVDMTNAHNQLKAFIEDGESAPNWPFSSDPILYPPFLGIKDIDILNSVTVVMPT